MQFAEGDGLPQQICKNCVVELNDAFSFALKCERIDKILKECILIDNKNINNSVIEDDNMFEDITDQGNVSDDVGNNDYEDENSCDEIKVKRKKQKRIKIMRNVGKGSPFVCKSCDINFEVN